MSQQIPLLEQQIFNLNQINQNWYRTDSIKNLQLTQFKIKLKDTDKSLEDLNKSLKIKNKVITYGTCALTVSICLLLLK